MSVTSCIRHPEKNVYIQLFNWQVKFCKNNHCAALLLAHLTSWHDWKLRHDQYYRRFNDIVEMHGDGRPHLENAYLFFTTEQLIEGCMGIYGKKAISDGLELLISLNVISIHKNPNPRYCFDKTKYFKFFPEICNQWIRENYSSAEKERTYDDSQVVDNSDSALIANRGSKKVLPSQKDSRPLHQNDQAITDSTNNTTNKNKSMNGHKNFIAIESDQYLETVEQVMHALKAKGMSEDRMQDGEDKAHILQLVGKGATIAQFMHAYDLSLKATHSKGNQFGMRYLSKVVDNLITKQTHPPAIKQRRISDVQPHQYENDFRGGLSWMGDLVESAE